MAEPITDEHLATIGHLANGSVTEYFHIRRDTLKALLARLTAEREAREKAEKDCDCKQLVELAGTVSMKFISHWERANAAEAKLTAAEEEAARLREANNRLREYFNAREEVDNVGLLNATEEQFRRREFATQAVRNAALQEPSRLTAEAEAARLREALAHLRRAIIYPVDTSISPRGWNRRPINDNVVSYLVETIDAALTPSRPNTEQEG